MYYTLPDAFLSLCHLKKHTFYTVLNIMTYKCDYQLHGIILSQSKCTTTYSWIISYLEYMMPTLNCILIPWSISQCTISFYFTYVKLTCVRPIENDSESVAINVVKDTANTNKGKVLKRYNIRGMTVFSVG